MLVWGGLAHLVADWLLQTEWMVRHKADLRHPAGLGARGDSYTELDALLALASSADRWPQPCLDRHVETDPVVETVERQGSSGSPLAAAPKPCWSSYASIR